MLYWAVFTLGFLAGAIISFSLFAAKDLEEEAKLPVSKKAAANSFIKSIFGPIIDPVRVFMTRLPVSLHGAFKIVAGQKDL